MKIKCWSFDVLPEALLRSIGPVRSIKISKIMIADAPTTFLEKGKIYRTCSKNCDFLRKDELGS